jgi:dipeptidyl aminopeptidase/acylaminoacyl peptidase
MPLDPEARFSRLLAVSLAMLLAAASLLVAQQTPAPAPSGPPATAAISHDGRRAAWPSDDGRSVWSATRKAAAAPWEPPARLLTIRGTVRSLAFSPDNSRIAFENPRAITGGRGRGAAQGPTPSSVTWAFIVVFDIAKRTIAYVDPQFGIDSNPSWSSDGREITFTRQFGDLPAVRLTRPAPDVKPWTPPPAKPGDMFSLASALAVPFVYAPVASGDRRSIAYVAREGVNRNIYFLRIGQPARLIVHFGGDDGQELTTPAVSQTGGAVAFVRGATSNPTSLPDPPESEVWIVSTRGGAPQQLGPGLAPRFSDDDRQVRWTSAGAQFFAPLTWSGGSLVSVGKAERAPAAPPPAPEMRGAVSPDGRKVANRAQSGVSIYDIASKTSWAVPDSAGSEATLLWSPDSRFVAFRKNATGTTGSAGINGYRFNGAPVARDPFSVWVIDVASSTVTEVFRARAGIGSVQSGAMFWSDDHRVAFQWEGDGWQHYYSVPATGGSLTLMTRGDGDVEFVEQSPDRKHLIITSNIGDLGRRHISIVDFSGGMIAIIRQGAASQWSPVPLADGRLAYLEATHAMPPTVMIRERDGSTSAAGLPKLPASSPASTFVEPMLVEYPALDGQTAFGQLFVPATPTGCGIIFAHGGIRRQMLPGFHYMDAYTHLYELNQYLVSRGCVVLSVEYRSSIMRGYAFRHAPGWGHAGASEMLDVAGGARYLMARADVDAARGIGIHGLSWGGYITAQALARYPELFSVGFDIAGVHTSGDAAGVPHSAMAFIDQWKAPILLAQGDDDRNVVFTEGIKLARELLKRPAVRLVQRVVPNETHDLYLTFENMVTIYQEGAEFLLATVGK